MEGETIMRGETAPGKDVSAGKFFSEKRFIEDYVRRNRENMLDFWEALVNRESFSGDKPSVDALAAWLAERFDEIGGTCELLRFAKAGNGLAVTLNGNAPGRPVLLLGHYDTVFPPLAEERRTFRIEDGRAYGPGVLDMKGGITIAFHAVRALLEGGFRERPIRVLLAGDEETGHPESDMGERFRAAAAECVAAFNLETGALDDGVIVERKGMSRYLLDVRGRAAHAGRDLEEGRSAVLEAAHKTVAISAASGEDMGFNVGVFRGGTVANVVADRAELHIDVRTRTTGAAARAEALLRDVARRSTVEGTEANLSGGMFFPPMERTPGNLALFEHLRWVADSFDLPPVHPAASGGSSDSAFTVAAGTPTADQLGVKGRHNHSPMEWADVASLFERTRFLFCAVATLGNFEKTWTAAERKDSHGKNHEKGGV
ncbi:M20/M25/M40 family metallo-hydrolase [Aminiphilus circumscriptus]|jgi:glutamate carboxypeptidase|uniref:M20/M25/M40 family metallo-hydrolase n=1 Tax=Aminiphilus circumscriptus TaxID=290732 RepID=UPI00146FA5B4|nr:M20/M25/M40 family metallo-hydrolase [Aminiphilus circumscriptus]